MEKIVKVVAVGDNCIDYYDATGESYPGGNPVNVAVYIKRLGGESSYIGAVGTDEMGQLMISALEKKGVNTSNIQIIEGKTAVTHVEVINGDRVFGDYEEGVLANFQLKEEDFALIFQHDLLVTGIWGMIENRLPLIIKKIPVAFDFANKYANPILEQAISNVTYAFFSYDEESREDFLHKYQQLGLEYKEDPLERLKEFMKAMHKRGPRVVVATMGENGSIAFDGKTWYRFGIVQCNVVDTMGAGDSFIAGFLYGSLQGLGVQEAMEVGAKNSALTLEYKGAW